MVFGIYGNMNMNMKMEYKYTIFIHSQLVWILCWKNEVKWRNEIGGQLWKLLTVLKPLTTSCTNTTKY